jgi:sulfite exporter TauE/SafE
LKSGMALTGGLLMVLFGFMLLKVIRAPLFSLPSFGPHSLFGHALPRLFASNRIASKWALGFAAGFLPCMLSWAMIVKAASTASPVHGFLTMAFFGLGTVPALFFTGLSASLATLRVRLTGERVAACSVIVMGIILLVKGARYFA